MKNLGNLTAEQTEELALQYLCELTEEAFYRVIKAAAAANQIDLLELVEVD